MKQKYCRRGDYVKLILKGFCMGTADIIPGISGGTIAFILGIYEDLIRSIKSFDLRFARLLCRFRFKEAFSAAAWQFLGAVCLGITGAILTLSKAISWLLQNKPVFIHSFFFGLILATAPIIARIIKGWTPAKVAAVVSAAAATYVLVGMVPLTTPQGAWFVFLCGAVAISAMILPGISGAFILVLLGKYAFILDAVNQRDFFVLGVFCLGVVTGIAGFVRVLDWLFSRYHDLTVTVLTGVVIGSLRKVWPWKEVVRSITTGHGKVIPVGEINMLPGRLDGEVLAALLIMVVGFILAFALNPPSRGKFLKPR